jgi:hypothetical protein
MSSFKDNWVPLAKMEAWYRSQYSRAVFDEFREFPGAPLEFLEDGARVSKKGTAMCDWRISLSLPGGGRREIAHHIALKLESRYGGPPYTVVSRIYRTNHEFEYGTEGGAPTYDVPLGQLWDH